MKAEEQVARCADKIELWDQYIHAWAYFNRELALEQARAIDKKTGPLGRLAGMPVGVKDVMNTKDMPTQMGSPIWNGFQPGNDARVVYNLRMADAVIMGKTVTAEFAVHTPGPTCNPHDQDYSPGTSSSGSAAAVACGMVPLALGTQTAGSIIRPASYCGVYGFKPSFGLIPRTAVLKTTDTLDTIGMFAQSVEDLELLFTTVRVKGRDHPVSSRMLRERGGHSGPWRIALICGPKWDYAEPYAQRAIFELAYSLDADVLTPGLYEVHDVHATIYDRTLAYYFREEFKQHTLVSPVMYEIVERGNRITLDQYKAALARQRELAASLDKLFENYDIILNLSTGGEAPLLGGTDRPDNCLIWTLCGVPAISVPVFKGPNGLPYGAQLVARRYADYQLLSFCKLWNPRLDHRNKISSVKGFSDPSFPPLSNRLVR